MSAFVRGSEALLSLIPQIKNVGVVRAHKDIKSHAAKQEIIIKSGEYNLFLTVIKELHNIDQRILFVKNIELFPTDVFATINSKEKIMLSGDVELCLAKSILLKKKFKTKIFFSHLPYLHVNLPEIEKYEGIYIGQRVRGIITAK